MTRSRQIQAFAAALAATAALSACGSDEADVGDPIPAGTADEMKAKLDQFQEALDAGECDTVDSRISSLLNDVSGLDNADVGPDVQNALADGIDHLRSLANDACNQEDEDVETTPETTPEETVTETTPTETVPPETTTTPTETTTTPTTTIPVEPPPDEGDGDGQFDPDNGTGGVGPDGEGPPGQRKKFEDED